MPTKCTAFWNCSLLQPTNKIDYFSYFKVFPVAVIPQQHGWIFFQTRTQLVYTITALTASEESDESSQEPFRCGVGNLFRYYQKLIQYPVVCYTEQISNGSGEKSSASDALCLFPKREKEKDKAKLDCSQRRYLVCCRKEHSTKLNQTSRKTNDRLSNPVCGGWKG